MTRDSANWTASVLVVEHSVTIRRLFEVVLRDVADPLFIVEHQHEARGLLETESIDVIVLEPQGPRHIDWELLEYSKAAGIPTIVVTSRADEKVQEEAARRGAAFYMTKPFMPARLQMIVRNITAPRNT